MELLKDEKLRCYSIGTELRLKQNKLNVIRVESSDRFDAMNMIISNWLRRNYSTEKFGPPTWKMLVEAVRARTGGNNPALAEKIAKAHPSPVSYCHVGRRRIMIIAIFIPHAESR